MLLAYSGKRLMRGCSVTQSCPTLCNSVDYRRPGSPVYGILQARILEWVASFGSHEWVRLLSPTGHVRAQSPTGQAGRALAGEAGSAGCLHLPYGAVLPASIMASCFCVPVTCLAPLLSRQIREFPVGEV